MPAACAIRASEVAASPCSAMRSMVTWLSWSRRVRSMKLSGLLPASDAVRLSVMGRRYPLGVRFDRMVKNLTDGQEGVMDIEQPKRRRRRTLKITVGVLAVLAVALAFALRTPSPVGHWNSAEGQAHFTAAYNRAMRDMPPAAETLDVRTGFGFVRVYRYEGEGDRAEPLVLLPGRASASPVWADNLPHLLKIVDVYTVDLLGEPGRSVQEAPITSDADQAAWLDEVLAQLPEESFHVVGLSIGGWTAANLAVHRPRHVATLTLIDPVFTFSGFPVGTAIRGSRSEERRVGEERQHRQFSGSSRG